MINLGNLHNLSCSSRHSNFGALAHGSEILRQDEVFTLKAQTFDWALSQIDNQAVQEIQARVLSLQLEKQTYVRLFTR